MARFLSGLQKIEFLGFLKAFLLSGAAMGAALFGAESLACYAFVAWVKEGNVDGLPLTKWEAHRVLYNYDDPTSLPRET